MSEVLGSISQTVSTRTLPVFAPSVGTTGTSYSFFSSFRSDAAAVWSGVLERQRTQCGKDPSGNTNVQASKDNLIEEAKGDKFAQTANSADGTHPRRFFTFVAAADASGKVWSDRSIRPAIPPTNPDGIT